jgi:AAA15 family ATPase/GTPase
MIILLYGQPASGKTTLSDAFIEDKQICDFFWNFIRIDGDKWREVTKNKDYSKEGRVRNLKGAFDMALYLEKEGYTPILSFVTPYQELRNYLKENAKDLIQIYLEYKEDRGRNDKFANDFEYSENDFKINTSVFTIQESISKIKEIFFNKVEPTNKQHYTYKQVPYFQVCACNPINGGNGDCNCSISNKLIDVYE